MDEENKTASDQSGEQVEQRLNDIQNKAMSKGSKKAGKLAVKAVKQASKAIVKALIYIVKAIVAALGPYLLVLLFAFMLFYLAWDMLFETRGKEQSYQMQSTEEDNTLVKDDKGNYNAVALSKGNKMEKAFYTVFSDKSYYMVIGDSKTLYKPDDTNVPKDEEGKVVADKYGREKMFYLSPNALYTLDEFLNNNTFRFPEQFVQHVAYDPDSFTLKQLADDKGNLQVDSQAYDQKTTKPISGQKIKGVWDYGFAPILHYEEYREKKEAEGKYVQEEYWDSSHEAQCIKTKDIDERYYKLIYDKQVWMIDKVVSSAGTISNKITADRVKGDAFKDSEIYWEGDKPIYEEREHSRTVTNDDGSTSEESYTTWEIDHYQHVKLRKYIDANYYNTIPTYVGEPDTSQITGNKYFRDYFEHYSAFVPEKVMTTFNFTARTGVDESEINKIIEADTYDPSNPNASSSGGNVDMAQFQLGNGASSDNYKMALQYLPSFKRWGQTYGVDPYLLLAQACQESGGNHQASLPGGSNYNGHGVGLMQVEEPGHVITKVTAFNLETKKKDILNISSVEDVRNVDDNIRVGAMELAEKMGETNANVLLGVQAYNMGLGGAMNVVKASGMAWEDAKNNPSNLAWMGSRNIQAGDPKYIENVLRYYASPDDKVPYAVKEDGTKVTASGSIQTGFASGLSVSGGSWGDRFTSWIKEKFKEITDNFEELFGIKLPEKLDPNRIEYQNHIPENRVNDIINMMFSMEEKKYFSEYGDITDQVWKEKYAQLFSNPMGAYWQSTFTVSSSDYFPNGFQSPVSGTPTILKGFGNVNNGGSTEFHRGVDVVVPQGTPIYAVADGTVSKAENNSNDKALGKYVQIQHTPDVYTVYGSMDTITVKDGDKVTKGQQIGTSGNTGDCGGYVLHFELVKSNQHVDGSWVITGKGVNQTASGPLSIEGSAKAQAIYQTMSQYLGSWYAWGGTTPPTKDGSGTWVVPHGTGNYVGGQETTTPGFDCSGFTQYAFRQNGITIPRTSEQQMNSGSSVSVSDAQPGDLLFWHSGGHVGMYIGDGKYIHAPKTKDVVKISTVNWGGVEAVRRYIN
jgi:Membrane proteins related to metalloendopeptidases